MMACLFWSRAIVVACETDRNDNLRRCSLVAAVRSFDMILSVMTVQDIDFHSGGPCYGGQR